MAQCQVTDEVIVKIGDDIANIMMEMGLEDLSSSEVKSRFKKLLESYHEYFPLDTLVSTIKEQANEYGLLGDTALFFADEKEIKNIIEDGGRLNYIHNENNSSDKILNEEAERNKLAKDAKKDFLIKAYGTATDVRLKLEKDASIALANAILINRLEGNPVSSIEDLNNNVRNYQQQLFNKIVDYIKEYYQNAPGLAFDFNKLSNTQMYVPDEQGGWRYTGVVNDLESEIVKLLSRDRFSDDILENLFNADESTFEHRKLEAYNAWQLLSHFDSLMKVKYGDSLEIAEFGDMSFSGKNKYQRASKGAHNTKTWRNTDEIKLNEEVDNVIQELVNSTPLLNYGTNTQLGYLTFGDFSDILSKIKEIVYQGEDYTFNESARDYVSAQTFNTINGKSIKGLINSFRLNPQKYLSAVFEVLSNQELFDNINDGKMLNELTKSDKDIIYSIHKGITGINEEHSINTIAGKSLDCSIFEEISQACDSIFKINFLQYYKGLDGDTKVRNMANTRLDSILRNIRQTIKTKNNKLVPGIYQKGEKPIIKGIQITSRGDENGLLGIEFEIPNSSITVKVSTDGKVSYKRNGRSLRSLSKGTDFEQVIDFINNLTGQNISENTIELIEGRQFTDKLTELSNFASRVLFNAYISNVELEGLTTITQLKSKLQEIFPDNTPRIDQNMRELDLIHASDTNTIEKLANAIAIEQGLFSSSQIKSGSGNSQSQQSLSRLLGSMQSQWELQNRKDNSATKGIMILDPKFFRGAYTAKEYYDLSSSKDHTDFNVNEFATSMFMHDFIGGLMSTSSYNSLIGNGIIGFLPSVNSDKNTIGRILIDTNQEVEINGQIKRVRDLNGSEFEMLISKELGSIYSRIIDKVNSDFETVLSGTGNILKYTDLSFKDFNEKHKIIDPATGEWNGKYDSARALNELIKQYNLTHRHNPISITDQIHFISNKDGSIKPNKTILNFYDEFVVEPSTDGRLTHLHQFFQHKKADIIGSLLRSGFKVDLTKDSKEVQFLLNPDNLNQSWIDDKHGEMILGKVQIGGNVYSIRNKSDLDNIKKLIDERVVPEVEKAVVKSAQIGDVKRNNELLKLLDRLEKSDYLYDPQILADLSEFNTYLTLNPLLEKYNYMDYLFTQEFMISTVGTLAAHPVKKDDGIVEHEEAGRYNAQHKRNVSYTATMQEFTLGLLNGIPSDYNIAVVEDIKDTQYNVQGDIDDGIKPYDGATFVNPLIVYLENVSLGAAKAGITKKQFVHFYDENTASGGIIKTAGFGLTNDWMRNSPLLQKMMWKMTQGKWFGINGESINIDITKGFNGNIQYKPIYFKRNNKYYQITHIESIGNNRYNVSGREIQVEASGKLQTTLKGLGEEIPLNDIFADSLDTTNGVLVESNYDLWQLFGGYNSLDLDGTKLIPSETSIQNVVQAMNSIGVHPERGTEFTEAEIANIRTQDDIYQPLKHSDIHYVATAGAVKQGAANINKNSLYHNDEPFNFMKIHMYQAGIQLDKEHHADGSELSLMTQVINACAHKGFSLDDSMDMFDALRTLTDVGTESLLEPIKEFVGDPTDDTNKKVVEATVNTVLKALSKQSMNENDLLTIFASELLEKIKEGKTLQQQEFISKLPIDNPAVYAKFMSTVSVFLTNSGIKMKIPGILSVLTPSYNIMRTYRAPYYDNQGNLKWKELKWEQVENNDLGISAQEYLAEIQKDAPYVFQIINGTPVFDFNNLVIGRTYLIDGKSVKLVTPKQRKQLKQDILSGKYSSVQEDITAGKELGNYDVWFKGTSNGEVETSYTLWDLDSVQALFELKDVIDIKDDLVKGQMLRAFNLKYQNLLSGTSLNAKQIEKELRQLVRRDTAILSPKGNDFVEGNSVRIDGKDVVVNKSSIKTQAYELILPKIFINEFGLETNDQLTEIEQDPDFFAKRLLDKIKPTVAEENYYIALINGSIDPRTGKPKHYYLNESTIGTIGLHEVQINKFEENGKLYRVDSEGNHIYELSSPDDKIYEDADGNEIIITDNMQFYINHLNYATAKISDDFQDSIQEFVDMFAESNNKSAKRFYKYLSSDNITEDNLKTTMEDRTDYSEEVNKQNNSAMVNKNRELSKSINLDSDHPLAKYILEIGHEMHSSFLKSLEVVASRTPSQSMQSFMPMRIVAFDNPNINTAFVSTAQIWLQGSDYDIDAVSIAAYDIDNSGKLSLWSPYADLNTIYQLNKSMELPFPTGKEVEIKKSPTGSTQEINAYRQEAVQFYRNLFNKYGSLFDDRKALNIHLELVENPDLELLSQFINEINKTGLYGLDDITNQLLVTQLGYSKEDIKDFRLHDAIAKIVNTHNKYLSQVSSSKLTSIAKNYSMYKMYKVIDTPVNLIQAQSSVDAMTGPLKKIGNKQPVSGLIDVRTPGNVFNKAESIEDNQVGKEGIGICAVGMKSFFGLTAYNNYVANYGTPEQKQRLRLGTNGRGVYIHVPGEVKARKYDYLANINPKLISELAKQFAEMDNDTDAALILSALLSLATDNAKELQLSKLNAGTKTIGMYIYGVSIGMDFESVSKIMTSKVGMLLTELTKGNVFTGERGIFSIAKVFDYIETGPRDIMNRYDETKFVGGKMVQTPVDYIFNSLAESNYDKDLDPNKLFCKFAWDLNTTLEQKLQKLESLKGRYTYIGINHRPLKDKNGLIKVSKPDMQKYNQAIDALKEYIKQVDIVKNDQNTYRSLQTLSEGGEEFRVLGQILGLNQGLKTKPEETIQKVFDIQNAINVRRQSISNKINRIDTLKALLNNEELPNTKPGKTLEMFDLVRFCFDEDYKQEQILNYDKVKHSINILDCASTVPHFAGYLQSLAVNFQVARQTSRKFDTMVTMGEKLVNELNATSSKDKQQIFKGIGNYYSDYVRKAWMLDTLDPIIIPKGVQTIVNGRLTDEETQIVLGTKDGDASFKYLMENVIIPNLQKGKLGDDKFESDSISGNKFIKHLTSALLTNTVTHNPIVYYTLPINMLPSTDEERVVFNTYKSEFNKLRQYAYNLNGVNIPLVDLFYYYGLIAHYGKQGQQSLMPIFENLHQLGDFKLKDFHTYEALFAEEIPLNTRNLYPYILKTQNPYNATTKMIYAQDPETMVTEIWEKASKSKFKDEIADEAERTNTSSDIAWYNIQKSLGARNGYIRRTNSLLRNPQINNYYMTYDEQVVRDNNTTESIHLTNGNEHLGVVKIDSEGNVIEYSGRISYPNGTYSDLLNKYPILKKMSKIDIEREGKIVQMWDTDRYIRLIEQAISEENNECDNAPY